MIGIADQRVAEEPIALSDAIAVTALGLPGVVLSVMGILVGYMRGGVRTAIAGDIAAQAFSAITLAFVFG
ncbi:MAG: hypothetical protein ACKVZ6_09340 [Kineosporiaceae bacterium]